MVFDLSFNRNLFTYLNKENGLNDRDAAKIMGISYRSFTKRVTGKMEFKLPEMIAWANFVGAEMEGVFYARKTKQ